MSQYHSLFDSTDLSGLLASAGYLDRPKAPVTLPKPHRAPKPDPVQLLEGVKLPSGLSGLGSFVEKLSAIIGAPMFVADEDGLLLTGNDKAQEKAASLAAEAISCLQKQAGYTLENVDAFLLKAVARGYLVFIVHSGSTRYVVGVVAQETLFLELARKAVELIWNVLSTKDRANAG